MESIQERIAMVARDQALSITGFAKKVDVDPGNFNKKMKGTLRFTKTDLEKINRVFGISANWLMTGEGDMKSKLQEVSHGQQAPTTDGKPFYDVDFALGFDSMYNDEPNVPSRYISVPGYEKADFWCRTSGDSMKPFISNGDIIALREIRDWQDFLPMNEVYAIMTTNELRTVKVVRRGSDDSHLTLHAYNEEYEDQEINKAAIAKVYKVMGCIKAI